MVKKELVMRINELYYKSKTTGLNPMEKEEQEKLRREYIDEIKKEVKEQLDNAKNHDIYHHRHSCNCENHN
ncbi:MAG: DUF896 domain-containing protein [Thermoanaerobacteraceae bacterium]